MSKEAEIIPGTEYMRYDNDIHFAIKTGSGRQRDLVLVPQPSDDPHDPLNWSRTWKFAAVANQAFFCLVSLWLPLAIAPLTPLLMEEFYTYAMGSFLGPVISGNIATQVSWRWFFWVCTIVQGLSVVLLALFFPETKYRRQEGEDVQKQYTLAGLQHAEAHSDCDTAPHPIGDKQGVSQEIEQARLSTPSHGSIADQEKGVQDSRAEIKHDGYPSTKQRYAFITRPDPQVLSRLLGDILTPVKLFTFPIILWASFSMCFYANCVLALNLTQSEVFAQKPYGFAPSSVGFVTLALLGGSIIGLVTAGPLSDYISAWSTKRNGGIREPEMRLPAIIPFMLANVVGMTVIAVGYRDHWSWQILVIIGWGLVGFSCATVPALTVTYAVDCYKPVAGQIMVTCTIVKNTFGFGMTYYINKWAESSGYLPGIMMMMGLGLGTSSLGLVVFYKWGKQFRTWTAQSSVHSF